MIVNGREMPDPTAIRLEPPDVVDTAVNGEPFVARLCSLKLGYSLTAPSALMQVWIGMLGQEVRITLPGLCRTVTGYVSSVDVTVSADGFTRGLEVSISGVDVQALSEP